MTAEYLKMVDEARDYWMHRAQDAERLVGGIVGALPRRGRNRRATQQAFKKVDSLVDAYRDKYGTPGK